MFHTGISQRSWIKVPFKIVSCFSNTISDLEESPQSPFSPMMIQSSRAYPDSSLSQVLKKNIVCSFRRTLPFHVWQAPRRKFCNMMKLKELLSQWPAQPLMIHTRPSRHRCWSAAVLCYQNEHEPTPHCWCGICSSSVNVQSQRISMLPLETDYSH